MGKIFITIGMTIFIIGIIMYVLEDKIGWFGNLYGDMKIIKSNYSVYIPLTSMILVSIILTIILTLFSRFFK